MRPVANMTDLEQIVLEEVFAFHHKNKAKREILVTISGDGRKILSRTKGLKDRVDMPAFLDALLHHGKKIRLFHNHPSHHSLSYADWKQSVRWGGRADPIVVVGDGSVFSGAARNVARFDRLLKRLNTDEICGLAETAVSRSNLGNHARGLMAKHHYLVSHIMNLHLANRGYVFYDYDVSQSYLADLHTIGNFGIVHILMQEITKHIR